MAANVQNTGSIAAGSQSQPYSMPYTSFMQMAFWTVIDSGSPTVSLQAAPTATGPWNNITGLGSITNAQYNSFQGPVPFFRISVAGTGAATVHYAWGDNR